MLSLDLYLLAMFLTLSQASNIIYLENCTYAIDLYKQYLNLLWSSNDAHTVHIQAVYSLSSNQTLIPGHIYTYLSQSVALIPFFVRCTYPEDFSSKSYLPFTQCSSTITNFLTKSNHESTRTYLKLKPMLRMSQVPLIYTGEYNLLLSNCSFQMKSNIYQLMPYDIFTFRIDYESSLDTNVTSCSTCNQRTTLCNANKCLCRPGTIPWKLYQNKEYCIDITSNCSYDSQRCFTSQSNLILTNRSTTFLLILISIICFLIILLIFLFWCLFRNTSMTHTFQKQKDHSSNQSIFMINRHERTPSTISTSDSTKLSDFNQIDQYILTNEYVSTFYEEYPKILSDKNNGEVVLILA
ncbi:hypothetical protein I4U23_029722 [Adineta vaga]|nr:hypothetical protein I4U23_029722 [Adineta vaga]